MHDRAFGCRPLYKYGATKNNTVSLCVLVCLDSVRTANDEYLSSILVDRHIHGNPSDGFCNCLDQFFVASPEVLRARHVWTTQRNRERSCAFWRSSLSPGSWSAARFRVGCRGSLPPVISHWYISRFPLDIVSLHRPGSRELQGSTEDSSIYISASVEMSRALPDTGNPLFSVPIPFP
jgi:hypothetical protein